MAKGVQVNLNNSESRIYVLIYLIISFAWQCTLMFLWRLGKVLGFVVFFVSFVGFWSFFKVQSPTCNFSHGNTSYTVFVKIINARSNNISSLSKSCLLISTYAGYIMNNKSESICITLHWCSLTLSIAHKHRSLWTAGKQLLQSACLLPSKYISYESGGFKWRSGYPYM